MKKKPVLNGGGPWKKGVFNVSESKKYVASDSGECVYRSSYEWRFMKWCENNPNVKNWTSEPFSVPYLDLSNPNKTRNYWIDFVVWMNDGSCLWVEVKPFTQVQAANNFGKQYREYEKSQDKLAFANYHKTEAMNYSKWTHAEKYARDKNAKFMVITERFLKQ